MGAITFERVRGPRALAVAILSAVACNGVVGAPGVDGTAASVSPSGGDSASSDDGPALPGAGGPLEGYPAPRGTEIDAPTDALPALPKLTNVVTVERDDSVGIDFDPYDGAVDYRVYPLPEDGDIHVSADGSMQIEGAIYRCAGVRQTFDVANNLNSDGGLTKQSSDGTGLFTYDGNGFAWKTQVSSKAPLGYVYATAAADRSPVYALAGYTNANEVGWAESRSKIYTLDAVERRTLLAAGWRDDGVAFYVPAVAASDTVPIYRSGSSSGSQRAQYYFGAGDVSKHAKDAVAPKVAFPVLAKTSSDALPLMAVLYLAGDNHVELAAGNPRFQRAAYQGIGPVWHLEWAGLTRPTTLVVEALADGCPFQGILSPKHLEDARHQPFLRLDEIQKASSTGEVFVNGQFDGPDSPPSETTAVDLLKTSTMSPRPIARSFVSVSPRPHVADDWDWFEDFGPGSDPLAFKPVARQSGSAFCPVTSQPSVCNRWQSPVFDLSAYNIDGTAAPVLAYGVMFGQLWEIFDDVGSDVTGKLRFTAMKMGAIDASPDTYLHATMSVDMVSTTRRYPQLILSDQPAPVQDGLASANNNSLLFQAIRGPDTRIELQAIHGLVNGHAWDVNNQAPEHVFVRSDMSRLKAPNIAPDPAIQEHIGVDRLTRLDVFVSSKRAYVFLDGMPAGCTQYPSNVTLAGAVSVTFGDVLYHEGAGDELVCAYEKPFPFLHEHQCLETKRHFDDLGFKSGVAAPAWNESAFPCTAY